MENLERHPHVGQLLKSYCENRSEQILNCMSETDDEYKRLVKNRTDASMALKGATAGTGADALLERYTAAVYEQEIYEQNFMYRQAVNDTLDVLHDSGLL